ncbi:MAG: glycosyltransferase family 2 protein [Gemmataceae bacterium]|nr:glycosyltransferase family 2 protein [Gemmataceae bacterium]
MNTRPRPSSASVGRQLSLLATADTDSIGLEQRRVEPDRSYQECKALLLDAQTQLHSMRRSRGWQLLLGCYRIRDRVLPRGSRRRAAYESTLNLGEQWLRAAARLLSRRSISPRQYARWIRKNEPSPANLAEQRRMPFASAPTVSIIVPTFNTPVNFLHDMIRSVQDQTYTNWELCIADASDEHVPARAVLREYAEREPRLRVHYLPGNQGIAGNSNAALALATGEYVALLDHDDTLAPFALFEVVSAINQHTDVDFIYSDEDCINEAGTYRLSPQFKPDWSPDTLLGRNYVCHLCVIRRRVLDDVGGFRAGFEGSQDYDLVLRATENARRIVHVPKVLYHWRIHGGSVTSRQPVKLYAYESGRKAIEEHLGRIGVQGDVADGPVLGTYRVNYPLAQRPLVSVIIPNRDNVRLLEQAVRSVLCASYANCEIVIAENQSQHAETFAYYRALQERPNVKVLHWDRAFNYAAINNFAATSSAGPVLLFLNNDTESLQPEWLTRLVEHAVRPEIGAVGAKMYYPDRTIQHAGVVVGTQGGSAHVHRFWPGSATGYGHRLITTQNVSAVTGACLMMRRAVFDEVGGFDEAFVMDFNDIDLCLTVRAKGYRIVWTPHAELVHHECKTRGSERSPRTIQRFAKEETLFREKWGQLLKLGDPYCGPNLSLENAKLALRP